MPYTTIISSDELEKHLGESGWVLLDCRFDLANPYWGFEEYQKAHIPGAVYASLDRDLSSPITPHTGRHPLPDPKLLNQRLSEWGIHENAQVIVYDTLGGAYAARLWWMLRWLSHPAVAVLDGGFPKWQREGKPTRSGSEKNKPAIFSGQQISGLDIDAIGVDKIRLDPDYVLIDARAPIRFRGEQEPIDTAPGHIPGAKNRFHGENLSPEGVFLPPEELRKQYLALLNGVPADRMVVYCGSGVTSCHNLLAMEIAGLPGARLYPGSWSEWIRDPQHPRALGDP